MVTADELKVWIASSGVAEMKREADAWKPDETGGVLLGYWIDPRQVVVTDVTDGGPHSTRTPRGFLPDPVHQARRVTEVYETSGRLHTYLGDWHTHPCGGLALSRTDIRTMRRIGRDREARCSTPLMLLFAGPDEWRLGAWSGQRTRGGLIAVRATVREYG